MLERETTGSWLPLMEYSVKRGISLSTLRRYIKAGKVLYKVEQGRYLLLDDCPSASKANPAKALPEEAQLQAAVSQLEKDLTHAREEIADLKTLIALYEETVSL